MGNVFQLPVPMEPMGVKLVVLELCVQNVLSLILKYHFKPYVEMELLVLKVKGIAFNVILLEIYVYNVMIRTISSLKDLDATLINALQIQMDVEHALLLYLFAKFATV